MTARLSTYRSRAVGLTLILSCSVGMVSAQTRITVPPNKYSPADDVKLGLDASKQAREQLPMLDDARVGSYVDGIGRRLVEAIPPELRHAEFRYTFEVVNQKEINAFALPGGPMFVNRGMIEAAKMEGEVAGVMAHEISHVVLRHGTAQATKGQKLQIGAIAGQVLGAIVGGTAGSVIAQGSSFGLGTFSMKYSREFEKQADLMGAQIMARAGYDPRDMASMFQTIEKQGGGGGPEWMSDHPNPGNRSAYITQEARSLHVDGSPRSDGEFTQIQSRLQAMSPAFTAEQIAQRQKTGRQPTGVSGDGRVVRVEAPAPRYRTYDGGSTFRVSVPDNWQQATGRDTLMFAPEGALFQTQGGTAFTHGVEVGVARSQTQNLRRDTDALLQGFARGNPRLRLTSGYQRTQVGGRQGLAATLSNVSDITGQPEYVSVSTTQLRDGNLLYVIGVVPQTEARSYAEAFDRVRQGIQLNDR